MYDGQVNAEVLSSWSKQLEVYFVLYQIEEAQHIYFFYLIIEHALLWSENYVDALRIRNKNKVMKWEDFNALMKSQFYPIDYEEE